MARVVVLRTDMDNQRVQVTDVESTSQQNYEFREGQEKYLRRPVLANITAFLLENSIGTIGAAAIVTGTVDLIAGPDVSLVTIAALDVNIAALSLVKRQELQSLLSYYFLETEKFKISFKEGMLDHFGSAAFVWDGTTAPFLEVLTDNGLTPYHLP